jgi:isopentenyl diphosphate isomerase/L-lactate dehydrogenase-like FMN-dependent dehydrogenase
MSAPLFETMFGSASDGVGRTDAANRAAFAGVELRPRVLVDVRSRTLATTVLRDHVALPVLLGPIGGATRAHPDAEIAVVRAAAAAGTATVVSLASSHSIEAVVAAAGGPVWFQLYLLKSAEANRRLAEHAEAIGCSALVVTVDNPGVLTREDSRTRKRVRGTIAALGLDEVLGARGPVLESVDPAATWREIELLRSHCSLPIVVKGIQTAEDAALCREHGAAAIVVSNHGGQALVDPLGTLRRLPEVVAAAGGLEIYLDGGVREGADVLKALALGARAVLIGRAHLWGLAVAGEAGVRAVLEILRGELEAAMMFCGVTAVAEVDRRLVAAAAGRHRARVGAL